ncbi:MAG: hypothetical protein ABIR76_01875 [Polaromonas sp.]
MSPLVEALSVGTVFLHDFAHWGMNAIISAMVTVQVGAMVLRVQSGYWTDRHQNRRPYLRARALLGIVLFGALAAMAAWASMCPAVPPAMGIALVALLTACGIGVSTRCGLYRTGHLAGAQRAGTALGMANTSVFAVCFVTPLSIPYLLAWQGWAVVWTVACLCALVTLPLLAVAAPHAAGNRLKHTKLLRGCT